MGSRKKYGERDRGKKNSNLTPKGKRDSEECTLLISFGAFRISDDASGGKRKSGKAESEAKVCTT